MATIAFFGSSKIKTDSAQYSIVKHLGKHFAEQGYDIATGGYRGVMEAALNGAKKYPVERIGVTTKDYPRKKPNAYVSKQIACGSYLERLDKLIDISDAYIVFGGSSGTLLELVSLIALKDRKKIQNKAIVVFGDDFKYILNYLTDNFKKFKKIRNYIFFTDDLKLAFDHVESKLGNNKADSAS
jgi:uncharacterized protein (TIGR00725 family)